LRAVHSTDLRICIEPTIDNEMTEGIMNGYVGNIAWVDLTSGSARTEALSEEIARRYKPRGIHPE
jgi:hypothetical protein